MAAAAAAVRCADGLLVDFVLPPGAWVDLDTLLEATAAGLRDAGALAPRFAGLDVVVATKRFGDPAHGVLRGVPAASLNSGPPGPCLLDAYDETVPRPGGRDRKRAWRDRLAGAWGDRPQLAGAVWADVALNVNGSLLGPLEVVLDALEPVLGRDPRGRDWQEFFPNDDRIEWLRVRRATGPAVRLTMGRLAS